MIKKILLILFIMLISSEIINGQQKDERDKGPFALQFKILNLLDFASFKGAAFSGKYTIDELNALRLGIDVFWYTDVEDIKTVTTDAFGKEEEKETTSDYDVEIDLFIDYMRYLIDSVVNLYVGIGIFGGLRFFGGESEEEDPLGKTKAESLGTGWSVGLVPFIGCEWWFHSNLSLSLEYQLRLKYNQSYEEEKTDYPDGFIVDIVETEERRSYWWVYPYRIDLGLTVYF